MPRGDQLIRQWKIMQIINASKYGKSIADLAEELECNLRTVYRDIEVLQCAGFPLYNERVQGKNLWLMLETVNDIPAPNKISRPIRENIYRAASVS